MSIFSFKYNPRRITVYGVLLSLFCVRVPTLADVIYLISGDVLIVERAWIEGNQVKYQATTGIESLPADKVRRIQEQKPEKNLPSPLRNYGIAQETSDPGTPQTTSVPLDLPPAGYSGEVSFKVIERLKENLKANPADSRSRNELAGVLNSLGSLQYSSGDLA